ncbi:hypothetical protein QVD17_06023 [Tagetes erecta]|uniref:GBF-interacting protein 1 N-terminal domain-containing protein n=1 Tax=Tagetes erecta TaxID=13708 RepID=A0AAD8LIM7_TARER|nr:hypothetical protein QVD17_06023 [Tagetes erecta]
MIHAMQLLAAISTRPNYLGLLDMFNYFNLLPLRYMILLVIHRTEIEIKNIYTLIKADPPSASIITLLLLLLYSPPSIPRCHRFLSASHSFTMTTTGGGGDHKNTTTARVSIPATARKLIQQVTKTLRYNHTDDFIYTTLTDSAMNPTETTRRLNMIHDIIEIAGKHSVEDVYTMLKECNLDANEAAQRLLYIDTFHVVKKKHDRRKTMVGDASQENKVTRGNLWRGDKGGRGAFYVSKVFEDVGGGRNVSSGKEYGVNNRLEKVLRPTLPSHIGKENNVDHVLNSCANVNGTPAVSNGSHNHKLSSELSAEVASSASDHVVVSSQNTKHICAVGTIKCEIVKRYDSNESNARTPAGVKSSAGQLETGTIPVIAEVADSDPKSIVAEKRKISESLKSLSLSTQNSSLVVSPVQDNQQPVELPNEPLKGNASEHTDLVTEEESELNASTPKLDVMTEKLTSCSNQAVIFPDHLQVPENYKCQFIFGSLDANPDDCKPTSVTESTQEDEVVKEHLLSNGNVSVIAQDGATQDNVLPSDDNISTDPSILKQEQTKVDIVPPPTSTGFQNLPVFQTPMDYSYGCLPPPMGPHFVQVDIPELQNGNSQVVSAVGQTPVTQPSIVSQSSIALSPPVFPYYRPYPSYIPYNPYFYLSQNAHMLNHGVFPQPPSPTTNIHHMLAAAAGGVKLPTPSQNKQGSNEDITTSETKVNNIVSTVQQLQGEDLQAWAHASVHDLPTLMPNYFYHIPQPHHMAAFQQSQAGALYHSSQIMTPQPNMQPPFMYQSQSIGGTGEPMVQPSASYHQHQHAPQVNLNDTSVVNTGTS